MAVIEYDANGNGSNACDKHLSYNNLIAGNRLSATGVPHENNRDRL